MSMSIHMTDDLTERLRRTRLVATPWSDDQTRGVTGAFLGELLDRWANSYDWAVHERRIGALPWATMAAGGTELRVIHQRSADAGAPVVVLLHGWPDSVLRFERVLPLLADLHVVVPALPGFPFAPPLATPGLSVNRIAAVVADALDALGYPSYTVSGGDVGGTVAGILAAEYPDRVAALHLTDVSARHALTADPAKLAPDAAAYLGRAAQWFRTEGGYIAEQSTRPNTLAVALGDSPAGLAAWIVEKLQGWSGEAAFTPGRASHLGHRLLGDRYHRLLVRHLRRAGHRPRPDRDADRPVRVPARHQAGAAQLRRGVPERLRLRRAPGRRPLRRMGTAPKLRRRSTPRGQPSRHP